MYSSTPSPTKKARDGVPGCCIQKKGIKHESYFTPPVDEADEGVKPSTEKLEEFDKVEHCLPFAPAGVLHDDSRLLLPAARRESNFPPFPPKCAGVTQAIALLVWLDRKRALFAESTPKCKVIAR
jgi:hypothetical protein